MNLPNVESLARQVELKSAINPCLWLCVSISLPAFGLSIFATDWLRIGLFVIGLIPVVVFLVSFLFLLFTRPEFLRSERYQMYFETLKFLGDKDHPSDGRAIELIALLNNPNQPPPLPEKHE